MAMREGHIAAATPAAFMWGWTVADLWDWTAPGLLAGTFAAFAVMTVCTAPDWDHPRFEGRMHPLASVSRWYARLLYRKLRTDKDRQRADLHRGPTHCLETALLMGVLFAGVLAISEQTRPFALAVGVGVTIGWADHVMLDWCTPSGVPVSFLWSRLRHGVYWRRTTLSRRWTTVPVGPVAALLPSATVVAGRRVKAIPRPCILPGDERAPSCCDKGWFKTDKGAEHAVVIPGFYLATVLLGLARAGIIGLVITALTGWA